MRWVLQALLGLKHTILGILIWHCKLVGILVDRAVLAYIRCSAKKNQGYGLKFPCVPGRRLDAIHWLSNIKCNTKIFDIKEYRS